MFKRLEVKEPNLTLFPIPSGKKNTFPKNKPSVHPLQKVGLAIFMQ